MSKHSPFCNSDALIQCTTECSYRHTNRGQEGCMTTGRRYHQWHAQPLEGLDYCPCGLEPRWRWVDAEIYCDHCDERIEEVLSWWEIPEVITWCNSIGIYATPEQEAQEPTIHLCSKCCDEIVDIVKLGYFDPALRMWFYK